MNHHLSVRGFYTIIVAGVVLGALGSGTGAWSYLKFGDTTPDARKIWGDTARDFVIPIAVMMGATFGGLIGVALAVLLDRKRSKSIPMLGRPD